MRFNLTILGSGSSAGIPILSCPCKVCQSCYGKNPLEYKNIRTRTSIMLTNDEGKNLIVDTGPDFREQMFRHKVKSIDSVIYTHIHFDHTSGFDDLRAYSFFDKTPIKLYIPENMKLNFMDRFEYCFRNSSNYKGTTPQVDINILEHPGSFSSVKSFELKGWNTNVEYFCTSHGNTLVYAYKIGSFLYLTDFYQLDEGCINFLKGKIKTVVISGINFKKTHFIHSTISQTQELLKNIGFNRAVITHICHDVDYYDESNSSMLLDNVELAYDGMNFDVDTD